MWIIEHPRASHPWCFCVVLVEIHMMMTYVLVHIYREYAARECILRLYTVTIAIRRLMNKAISQGGSSHLRASVKWGIQNMADGR